MTLAYGLLEYHLTSKLKKSISEIIQCQKYMATCDDVWTTSHRLGITFNILAASFAQINLHQI